MIKLSLSFPWSVHPSVKVKFMQAPERSSLPDSPPRFFPSFIFPAVLPTRRHQGILLTPFLWLPPLTSLAALKCKSHSTTFCHGTACYTIDISSFCATVLKCGHIWLPPASRWPLCLCPLLIPSEAPCLGESSRFGSRLSHPECLLNFWYRVYSLPCYKVADTCSSLQIWHLIWTPTYSNPKGLGPTGMSNSMLLNIWTYRIQTDTLLNRWCLQASTESNLSIIVVL